MALPAKIYAKNPDFVHREVAGESILVPIRRQLSDVNSLYVLNETGAAVWRRIDGTRSILAILNELSNEYDVTEAQCAHDLLSFVARMPEQGFIETGGVGTS